MDDLPLWGFVGEMDKNNKKNHYLFIHKNILVQYSGNQIIHVNLTQESPKLLEAGKKIDMTYSVKWSETNVTFAHRFDIYLDYPFFERQARSYCHDLYSVLCFNFIHCRLHKWWSLLTQWRQKLDKVDDPLSISVPIFVLWNWLPTQHSCYLLWVTCSYSFWNNSSCVHTLGFHLFSLGTSRNCCWQKLEWCSK
ncbi:uncharacterized protein A4U43_C04F26020 [Asparagus officinalis]|uniref:Transmembrane 9 superfamily member n=1 Tax=Asparagus officinalis TaxID=4686 RepID=A0A5P1F5G6_ASPOF|nr:uncharacterized protein A4U43_C04F26020 [Asparagus officinalis]